MSQAIRITAGEVRLEAELNDSSTAKSIAEALPIKARGNRWGEEIYFAIPVEAELEAGARDVLEA
ncbi:MAG: cyclophilin-like family protein, partial [Planctomycetota bacterium]